MRVIMTGGGTGGHIFPALAIADEVMKNEADSCIKFIGAKGKMEEIVVPENNYEIALIEVVGLNRKNMLKNINFIMKYYTSLSRCKKIIKDFKPDVVIGTGGYVTGPVVSSAVNLGIPSIIQEGNSYPGKVIKYLSPKVNKVIVNFEETRDYLKRKDNVVQISYPVRSKIKSFNKEEAIKFFNIKNSSKTVFVFGGSQGSKAINDVLEDNVEKLSDENINIIWQTGKANFKVFFNKFRNLTDRVKIYGFINDMDKAYAASDLVICRAGISSIMELSLTAKPAILIPYPYAAENHQELNAKALVDRDSAIMIREHNIRETLIEEIKSLLDDEIKLKRLSDNISKIYDIEAPTKIYKEIKSILK
ncbi:MAG: undecaprenyldiphospho-muramoylpentapeptide beta-N-acetylglucosaminyltransferase [Candidatus Kapaibacterium sp.]